MQIPQANERKESHLAAPTLRMTRLDGISNMKYLVSVSAALMTAPGWMEAEGRPAAEYLRDEEDEKSNRVALSLIDTQVFLHA